MTSIYIIVPARISKIWSVAWFSLPTINFHDTVQFLVVFWLENWTLSCNFNVFLETLIQCKDYCILNIKILDFGKCFMNKSNNPIIFRVSDQSRRGGGGVGRVSGLPPPPRLDFSENHLNYWIIDFVYETLAKSNILLSKMQ